jgi:5,10-methylenetetrahydromethanopterin reductase
MGAANATPASAPWSSTVADLGVSVDGRTPIGDIAGLAQAAESGGATTLWIACHLFLRDPVTTAALALGATRRLRVALMAMSPYSMHPVLIAMGTATLDEAFPGRVILCLGAGAPGDLAAAGIAAPKPVPTLREAITMCRALFAGETVGGRRLANGPRTIRIVLAASRRHMLELAGRSADGVLISAATAPAFVRACLDVAGGDQAFRRVAIVYTRVAASKHEAIDGLRRPIGFVLRGAHHAENIRLSGAPLDQAALAAAYAAENWGEVERLVGDEVVRRHAAAGTAAQVRARLSEYRAIGLDEIVLGGIDDAAGIAAALSAAREDA